jgi:5-formyltetrahydrofolate cyclo-ligase
MGHTIALQKDTIRRRMRAALRRMPPEDRRVHSEAIQNHVLALPAWQQAQTIMLYMSMPYEVATDKLIRHLREAGRSFVVPKCQDGHILPCRIRDPETDLVPNSWGLREPKPEALTGAAPARPDFILVPGIAFDRQGNRIGHGGGYYDRFLSRWPEDTPHPYILPVAFSRQVIEQCPREPFDYKFSRLLTEKSLLSTKH